jgi:hypothetical protein
VTFPLSAKARQSPRHFFMNEQEQPTTQMDEAQCRESGIPGGGKGRQYEVGGSGIYPLSSGEMPPGDDEYIRTPGQLGQRGRGLEGYYDQGEGGVITAPADLDSIENNLVAQPNPNNQADST